MGEGEEGRGRRGKGREEGEAESRYKGKGRREIESQRAAVLLGLLGRGLENKGRQHRHSGESPSERDWAPHPLPLQLDGLSAVTTTALPSLQHASLLPAEGALRARARAGQCRSGRG